MSDAFDFADKMTEKIKKHKPDFDEHTLETLHQCFFSCYINGFETCYKKVLEALTEVRLK